MAPSGDHGASARKHLRVLLPFTCDSLRIPDELGTEIGAGEALVVGPSGGKTKLWPVEVGWDGDGAFLGRGWPEFAAACGVGAGWLLVLRHRGRGVLTVKTFDSSCCLRELRTPPAVEATPSSKDAHRKPQLISVLPPDSMEKMLIPAKFVQRYIPKEHMNNHKALILAPRGKIGQIELEMNQSDVFFAGGWSQFLALHDVTEVNAVLLRYEGNMVFTVKVFEPNGCQRQSKHKEIRMQQGIEQHQEAPSASIQKRCMNNWPSSDGKKKPVGSMTFLNKASLGMKSLYEIGPQSWIRKQINANALNRELALATAFCNAIGLRKPCTITLKTSMNSTESWQVCGLPNKNKSYRLLHGWVRFCQENSLKEGDICTFNVVKTTLWHVIIKRCEEKVNQFCYEPPSLSSWKRKSETNWPYSEGKRRLKGSLTSLNKASSKTRCIFEIGPPASMQKEMNTSTMESHFSLPLVFCKAVGLREPRTITPKTSTSSTGSWQARLAPYSNCSHLLGSGWTRFCRENGIKAGDVCTFKLVETTLWHVIITSIS